MSHGIHTAIKKKTLLQTVIICFDWLKHSTEYWDHLNFGGEFQMQKTITGWLA